MMVPTPAQTNSNSGLIALTDGVRAFFEQDWVAAYFANLGVTIPFVTTTGWKQREQQINVNPGSPQTPGQVNRRVTFMPGTDKGDEGTFKEPRRTSNPRAIATWERLITCAVWAVDTSNLADEQAQITACDNLLEMTLQAIQSFAHADFVASSVKVKRDVKQSNDMPFGYERLFEFVHREPIYDIPQEVVRNVVPNIQRKAS
jgi:hypothetical protein